MWILGIYRIVPLSLTFSIIKTENTHPTANSAPASTDSRQTAGVSSCGLLKRDRVRNLRRGALRWAGACVRSSLSCHSLLKSLAAGSEGADPRSVWPCTDGAAIEPKEGNVSALGSTSVLERFVLKQRIWSGGGSPTQKELCQREQTDWRGGGLSVDRFFRYVVAHVVSVQTKTRDTNRYSG